MTDSKFKQIYSEFHSTGMLPADKSIDGGGLCSVKLEMKRNDISLATGTGFFWQIDDANVALITAWHNFSGLHHTTRKLLDEKHAAMPNKVRIDYMSIDPQQMRTAEFPLYLDTEKDVPENPRWFVHGKYGSYLDFCFIPLKMNCKVATVNGLYKTDAVNLEPGLDIFVVGFPSGISPGIFPIWKRGSIASDIPIPIEGHPKYLIDIVGRSGMSGSPAFRIRKGAFYEGDTQNGQLNIGIKREFIGIYTGRAYRMGKESSELGYVWRTEYLLDMLKNPIIDEQPETGKGVWTHKMEIRSLDN